MNEINAFRCEIKLGSAAGFFRPTKQQLLDAYGKRVPDLLAPGLKVLFCGINPGLYSAATKHHFARPGNRFWPALHRSGFTPRQLSPFEERELLKYGLGITNIVIRATGSAAELSDEELREGTARLREKVKRYKPQALAVLGVQAYRAGFGDKTSDVGRQNKAIDGTELWVLPNPSGLNAHYTLPQLVKLFSQLRETL